MVTLYRGHSKHVLGIGKSSNKKEKESEHILLAFLLVVIFYTGFMALSLFCFYIMSLTFYTFSDVRSTGDLAFVPKWIFLFSFLIMVGKTRLFKKWVEKK